MRDIEKLLKISHRGFNTALLIKNISKTSEPTGQTRCPCRQVAYEKHRCGRAFKLATLGGINVEIFPLSKHHLYSMLYLLLWHNSRGNKFGVGTFPVHVRVGGPVSSLSFKRLSSQSGIILAWNNC